MLPIGGRFVPANLSFTPHWVKQTDTRAVIAPGGRFYTDLHELGEWGSPQTMTKRGG